MDENQRHDWQTSEDPTPATPPAPDQEEKQEEHQEHKVWINGTYQDPDNQWNPYEDSCQNPNQNQNPNPFPGYQPQRYPVNGMAVASLVMGILSLLLVCCGFSFCFGALGILFALLSRTNKSMDPQARIGLGLSIGGTVIGLALLLTILFGNISYYSDYMEEYEKFYNEYENENFYPGLEDFADDL